MDRMKPKELARIGRYSLIQWDNGNVQLRKSTYNPKTKEKISQSITINSVEDALLIVYLLRSYYDLKM